MTTPSKSTAPLELHALVDDDKLNEMLHPNTTIQEQLRVTVLMSAGDTSDYNHCQMPPGSPSQSMNGQFNVLIDVDDPPDHNTVGDLLTIANDGRQAPNYAEVNRVGDNTLPAELRRDNTGADQEITPTVDLGWGIMVGELSRENFNQILSSPNLLDHYDW